MALVYHRFQLDVTPGAMPPELNVSEQDINRQIEITLMDGGEEFVIPTGTTATIEGTIGDHGFRANAAVDGGTVTFLLDENMTACEGRAWTKIKLTQGDFPVSTCGFWLVVDRAGVNAQTVIGMAGFEEQIKDAVSSVMDEKGIGIDKTLTVSGSAADAKVVGDLFDKTIVSGDTIGSNALDVLPNGKLTELKENSFVVFSPAGTALLTDAPFDSGAVGVLTMAASLHNAVQIAVGRSGNIVRMRKRFIYNYGGQTGEEAGAWSSDYIDMGFPVVNSGNIGSYLPNHKLSDAPANSCLILGPSATALVEDLPMRNALNGSTVLMVLTFYNSGTVFQLVTGGHATRNHSLAYRVVFDYGKTNMNAGPWANLHNDYTGSKWGFFGDSLCFRANSGFGFPDMLGISNYINNGVAQATMAYRSNSIPAQVDTDIAVGNGYDFIMIEGGYNDWYGQTLGAVPDVIPASADNIDRTTTVGGLMYSIMKLSERYPFAKIYYLAVHKINTAQYERYSTSGKATQEEIMNALIQVCKLFGVEVIDCYHDSGLNTYFSWQKQFTTDSDGIHPTTDAFRKFYYPVIKKHIMYAAK